MGDLVGAVMVGMILAVVWFVSRRFRRDPALHRAFLDGAADAVGDEDDLVL